MVPDTEMVRRLTTIPGVDRLVAWTIVAELGRRASFPMRTMLPAGADCVRAASYRRQAAQPADAQGQPLPAACAPEAAWEGKPYEELLLGCSLQTPPRQIWSQQATIFAVAHQFLRIAYAMLRNGEDYCEFGGDYYDRLNKPRTIRRPVERLIRLGYDIGLKPRPEPPMAAPDESAASPPEEAARRGCPCKCAERGIVCQHRPFRHASTAQPIERTAH